MSYAICNRDRNEGRCTCLLYDDFTSSTRYLCSSLTVSPEVVNRTARTGIVRSTLSFCCRQQTKNLCSIPAQILCHQAASSRSHGQAVDTKVNDLVVISNYNPQFRDSGANSPQNLRSTRDLPVQHFLTTSPRYFASSLGHSCLDGNVRLTSRSNSCPSPGQYPVISS
jgi:hypothetical protein